MTGQHIRKNADGSWDYPDHEKLERECGLFSIDTYIRRRRGTLRRYLETERGALLKEAMESVPPSKNANKVLWWDQHIITKNEMKEMELLWGN